MQNVERVTRDREGGYGDHKTQVAVTIKSSVFARRCSFSFLPKKAVTSKIYAIGVSLSRRAIITKLNF